jgi:adenine-specific DNA-methyltransferase
MASPKQPALSTATFLKGDVLTVLKKLQDTKCNLIVTSPPYNIGKIYERSESLTFEKYIEWLDTVINALVDSLATHGSICWQVGSFIKDGEVFPLDIHTYNSFKSRGMQLRNRIVWRFPYRPNHTVTSLCGVRFARAEP